MGREWQKNRMNNIWKRNLWLVWLRKICAQRFLSINMLHALDLIKSAYRFHNHMRYYAIVVPSGFPKISEKIEIRRKILYIENDHRITKKRSSPFSVMTWARGQCAEIRNLIVLHMLAPVPMNWCMCLWLVKFLFAFFEWLHKRLFYFFGWNLRFGFENGGILIFSAVLDAAFVLNTFV